MMPRIEQAVNLPPISRTEFMASAGVQAKLHGTAEWRSKLLSGDYEATRQHNLLRSAEQPDRGG